MSVNSRMLMELKNAWDRFSCNHPKFLKFWKAAYKNGLPPVKTAADHLFGPLPSSFLL